MKLVIIASLSLLTAAAQAVSVRFDLKALNQKSGKVYLAIFDNAGNFPDKAPFSFSSVDVKNQNEAQITLDLPEGDYAAGVYLDENGNNTLDTNVLGIPKERFGFSKNPKIRFGLPSYQECEFRVDEQNTTQSIKLIKLF